ETFFDPPPGTKTIALAPPEPNGERTYAHFDVLPVHHTRLVDQPRLASAPELTIAPDLSDMPDFSDIEVPGQRGIAEIPNTEKSENISTRDLVRAQLEQNLTPDLRRNFDLFLFVSTAAHGPAAQRLYIFRKSSDGKLAPAYDWAASTGRDQYERSPLGHRTFTATPTGFYQFDPDRMYRDYRSRAWDGAMPYAMFLNWEQKGVPTGVAVHATTPSTIGRLGKRASAGCIHISAQNAALLYKMIRSDYRGPVPRFAYDEGKEMISNRGDLMRNAKGQIEMANGFRVLIDIENFSGRDVVAALN
ncbi:MAG: L,D-transpeptidase, partial [Rhizomicrobium sp.]